MVFLHLPEGHLRWKGGGHTGKWMPKGVLTHVTEARSQHMEDGLVTVFSMNARPEAV